MSAWREKPGQEVKVSRGGGGSGKQAKANVHGGPR